MVGGEKPYEQAGGSRGGGGHDPLPSGGGSGLFRRGLGQQRRRERGIQPRQLLRFRESTLTGMRQLAFDTDQGFGYTCTPYPWTREILMKKWCAAFLALATVCVLGCVERALVITSDPPGATVTVNQQWQGTTPYVVPFKHYGVYDIWIEHPGVEENGRMVKFYPLHVGEPVKAPTYQKPGLDFVSEVMMPTTLRDQHSLHYVLERVAEADDIDDVLDRATQLRAASQARTDMRYAKDESRGRRGYEEPGAPAGLDMPAEPDIPYADFDATPPLPNEVPVFIDPY